MKPALTAEEWEAQRADEVGNGPALVDANGDLLIGYDGGEGLVEIERPHAVAALALYGQAFGFTREMVKALRVALRSWDGCDPDNDYEYVSEELRPLAEAAIANIESLLPPTEDQ